MFTATARHLQQGNIFDAKGLKQFPGSAQAVSDYPGVTLTRISADFFIFVGGFGRREVFKKLPGGRTIHFHPSGARGEPWRPNS